MAEVEVAGVVVQGETQIVLWIWRYVGRLQGNHLGHLYSDFLSKLYLHGGDEWHFLPPIVAGCPAKVLDAMLHYLTCVQPDYAA